VSRRVRFEPEADAEIVSRRTSSTPAITPSSLALCSALSMLVATLRPRELPAAFGH